MGKRKQRTHTKLKAELYSIETGESYTMEDFFNEENNYVIERFPDGVNVAFDFDENIVLLEVRGAFQFANLEWLRQNDKPCYNRYFELRKENVKKNKNLQTKG
jgi:hypothetical protein